MAKTSDNDVKKPKRGEKTAAWLLTGMLVLGLGGFGVHNFSGGTVTTIGTVGGTDIPAKAYARAIQQQVANFSQQLGTQIDAATAMTFGLDKQALSSVITTAALDNEAAKIGLSVGDETVAAEIRKQAAFQGTAGAFDRQTYQMVLDRNGWSEQEYEETLRRDAARSLLQGAVTGGFIAPAAATDAVYRWVAERRGFSMIRLTEADLATPLAEPDEAALKAWYEAHLADFTRPDAVRIRYAALLPETVAKDQPVDEAVLQKLYQERIDEFVVPERRLVERLVYPDAAARDAALAKAAAGTSFEDLVAERGLSLEATDLGDVSQKDLGAAGAAVFAAEEGKVIAADSDLGPALFRVNGTLQGEETTFDAARADLAAEIQMDAAKRTISGRVEEIDDQLAGGATLEELGRDIGMQVATLDHVPGRQGDEKIEGYQAFREAADKLKQGDFPEAVLLDDGGVVALEYVQAVPAAPIPFDEVRDKVAEAWRADALARALADQATAFKAAAEAGAALGTLGIVDVTPEIARDGTVEAAPDTLLAAVFGMKDGEIRVFEDGDFVAVLRLDRIRAAEEAGEGPAAMKAAIAGQFEQAFAEDAFAAFSQAVTDSAGISLDQAAINAVNTSVR